jgi:hypothetical protein
MSRNRRARPIITQFGVERIHENLIGGEDVAVLAGPMQGIDVKQQGASDHLLHVERRSDLTGKHFLDVVASVEHERDAGASAVTAAADDLDEHPKQLETDRPRPS